MTKEQIEKKAIEWFNDIAEMCGKLTSGNVSHLAATIKGRAIRSAEYIEKHRNDKEQKDVEYRMSYYLNMFSNEDVKSFLENPILQIIYKVINKYNNSKPVGLPEIQIGLEIEEMGKIDFENNFKFIKEKDISMLHFYVGYEDQQKIKKQWD